jgi:hypothetical protein
MMVSMHIWMLWRFLVIALMVFPFLVAAVVTGIRERHADGSISNTGPDDQNALLPSAGPDAWRSQGDTEIRLRSIDETGGVDRRAA